MSSTYIQGVLLPDRQNLRGDSRYEDSFAVFAKIILNITIFFKKNLRVKLKKMSIEGASDFTARTTTFYHNFFA